MNRFVPAICTVWDCRGLLCDRLCFIPTGPRTVCAPRMNRFVPAMCTVWDCRGLLCGRLCCIPTGPRTVCTSWINRLVPAICTVYYRLCWLLFFLITVTAICSIYTRRWTIHGSFGNMFTAITTIFLISTHFDNLDILLQRLSWRHNSFIFRMIRINFFLPTIESSYRGDYRGGYRGDYRGGYREQL